MRAIALVSAILLLARCNRPEADPRILQLGDQEVRRSEFDRYVSALESRGGTPIGPELRRQVLDAFLEERVLVLEARARGFVRAGEGPEQERQAVEQVMAQQARSGGIDDAAVQRYYAAHLAEFEVPERVTLRQVLLGTENEARDVRRQVERDAKNFDLLARTRSRSPEAAAGGLMGAFARGELPAELERAAFALQQAGQLSEPVKSPYGYHVLRLEERQPARQRPIEECRDEIRERLFRTRVDEVQKVFVRELLARARVDHEAALAVPRR